MQPTPPSNVTDLASYLTHTVQHARKKGQGRQKNKGDDPPRGNNGTCRSSRNQERTSIEHFVSIPPYGLWEYRPIDRYPPPGRLGRAVSVLFRIEYGGTVLHTYWYFSSRPSPVLSQHSARYNDMTCCISVLLTRQLQPRAFDGTLLLDTFTS